MNEEIFSQEQLNQLQRLCVQLSQQTQYLAETLREQLPEEIQHRQYGLTPEEVKYALNTSLNTIIERANQMKDRISE